MAHLRRIALTDRGTLAVAGPDAREFLQGIITNDIDKVDSAHSIYAALLTPQGKFLFDFFICDDGKGGLVLDTRADRLESLARRLDFYRLRAKVEIVDARDAWRVSALIGEKAARTARLFDAPGNTRHDNGRIFTVDPRLASLGIRTLHPPDLTPFREVDEASFEEYEAHRIALAVPEAGRDILVEKSFALESNFDHLNAVDFEKGCYVGQELTARTRYRGTVRRRLFGVTSTSGGELPGPGTPIMAGPAEIGEIRSVLGANGIALIRMGRLEEVKGAELRAGTVVVEPHEPVWFR